jgi:ketosteroid isomerase-like protein
MAETPQQAQARMDQETAGAKQAIATVERNYERYSNEGKADSIATLYTEQGRAMQPNGPALSGREAIRANEAQNMALFDSKLKITSENVVANGPIAIESGTYSFQATPKKDAPAGTSPLNENGKFLTHWQQVNGQWLIAELAWNSNQPLPEPAPLKTGTRKR